MSTLILLVIIFAFFISPFLRCFLFNLHNVGYYSLFDSIDYIIRRKWSSFDSLFGIDIFVGMFGHGKTLSMTHRARKIYQQFGDSVLFISNYNLYDIPYVPLKNFNQLLELSSNEDIRNKYQGFVVLIDEIEDVLSHRNYSNFPLQLLNVLTQQRKLHVYIMCSAQRFFMVDKIFRGITTHVIDCNKFWRFQSMRYFDAWDYENAMNTQLVRPLHTSWWFVKNKDFKCYSTDQMITENMSTDFISNDEKLSKLGLENVVNESAIKRPSRQLRKKRKSK